MPFRFSLETTATPEQVFRALTDVSERRLTTWRETLDPAKYELRDHGDTWAVVKEGTAGMNIWVVLRYEWHEPDTIRWTMVESNHCDRGEGLVMIRPSGSGSRVYVTIDQSGGWGPRGRTILALQRVLGPPMFPRMWKKALDRFALEDQEAG